MTISTRVTTSGNRKRYSTNATTCRTPHGVVLNSILVLCLITAAGGFADVASGMLVELGFLILMVVLYFLRPVRGSRRQARAPGFHNEEMPGLRRVDFGGREKMLLLRRAPGITDHL